MKTALQSSLALIAPSISIQTEWEHDPIPDSEIFEEGNALDQENREDWHQWAARIKVAAISFGDEFTGTDYLGSIWEKAFNEPEATNPTISGYEPQMTDAALEELEEQMDEGAACPLLPQIKAARAWLTEWMAAPDDAKPEAQALLPWFAISGRLCGDGEDTTEVFQCKTCEQAVQLWLAQMLEDAGTDGEDPADIERDDEGQPVYFINSTLRSLSEIQ